MSQRLLLCLALAAFGPLASCDGGVGGFLISDAEEASIGATVDEQIEAEFVIVDDSDPVAEFARQLVGGLVDASVRFRDPALFGGYKIEVIKDDALVNAFAAPGGYVYITTGLLAEAANCGEIAGVMGHELGHVTERHGVDAMGKAMVAEGLIGVFINNEIAASLTALAYDLAVNRPAGRADESESDEVGIQITHDAGYNPYGLVVFFERIQALEAQSGGTPPKFLSTHPPTEDRIKDAIKLIEKLYPGTDPDDPAGYACQGTTLTFEQARQRILDGQVVARPGTGQGAATPAEPSAAVPDEGE